MPREKRLRPQEYQHAGENSDRRAEETITAMQPGEKEQSQRSKSHEVGAEEELEVAGEDLPVSPVIVHRRPAARRRGGGVTLMVTGAEVDGLKFVEPTKEAVMACSPGARSVAAFHIALPLMSSADATTAPFSRKSTVPFGISVADDTMASSVPADARSSVDESLLPHKPRSATRP